MRRLATIVDVGRHAGVSSKTVSRVLNGVRGVSEPMRQRVYAAAKAVNYHPNMAARALVSRCSHLIGMIYDSPSVSYVTELQKGVLDRLEGSQYRLVVLPLSSDSDQEVVDLMCSTGLDGAILAPPLSDRVRVLEGLADAGIVCARVSPARTPNPTPAVIIDDFAAACDATTYLAGLGHREVATITGDPMQAATEARFAGYREGLSRAGLSFRPELVATGSYTRESGVEAALTLLNGPTRPTAIFAHGDDMAAGAIAAAQQCGLAVPDDISVMGFDDSEVAMISWPPLTTVRQPIRKIAVDATSIILSQLRGEQPDTHREHPHELKIRGSTHAPRGCES